MVEPVDTRRRRRRAAVGKPAEEKPVTLEQFGGAGNGPAAPASTGAPLSFEAPQQAASTAADVAARLATPPISDLEAARRRTAELLEHGIETAETTDKFDFDRKLIPDGWDYEWKTLTVYGQENPAYQVQLSRTGWEPVPASRHPEFMPADWKHATITRDGQILMQRPKEITDRMRLRDRRIALEQVRVKEAQLNSAPNGTFERGTHPGAPVRVKKGYEPMTIPE